MKQKLKCLLGFHKGEYFAYVVNGGKNKARKLLHLRYCNGCGKVHKVGALEYHLNVKPN